MRSMPFIRICVCITIALLSLMAARSQATPDLDIFFNDVKEITVCGSPGTISVFGPNAFAVIAGNADNVCAPLVAAATYGKGRIVVFGHDGYLNPDTFEKADTRAFLNNCISWARQGQLSAVGVCYNLGLLEALKSEVNAIEAQPDELDKCNVLIINSHNIKSTDIPSLEQFVLNGGGLITAATGWGWQQLNPGMKLATDLPANTLLAKAGLVIADGYAIPTSDNGFLISAPSELLNASTALEQINNNNTRQQAQQISYSIIKAIRNLPESDQIFIPRLNSLQATHYPTMQAPITLNDLHNRIALSLELIRLRNTPSDKIEAHPAAATFPGSVADDAQPVTRTITIDLTTPRWHSTGLYARPGEPIHISTPGQFNNKQIKVRIGCHTDTLWHHDKWTRMPEISSSCTLNSPETIAANAFGGLIYIEVPDRTAGGKIDITISNAVQAPYFILGQTTNQQWQQIRQNPAPWGELATDKVIISVPSDYLRNLNDPEALMHTWDKVLDACAELAGISPNRPSPERIVPDVQISVGYMHSGYPIMTHSDQYEILVNKDKLLAGQWGLYHELGHNHQNPDWTFAGTVEVTVNLFTLYVYDKVCGISPLVCDRSNKEFIADNFADYLEHGKDFKYWQDQPFLALGMYMQLQHAFGWQPFRNIFAQYLALPQNQRPGNDQEKMDQWLIRLSREIGHNLSPFFETWNIPVSRQAKESLKDLPDWTVTT